MNVLLCTPHPYLGVLGGAERANRALLEDLVARGHRCRVLAAARVGTGAVGVDAKLAELGIEPERDGDAIRFSLGGVEVCLVQALGMPKLVAREADSIGADWLVVPCIDHKQRVLAAAIATGRPVLYVSRATNSLPAGPDSVMPGAEGLESLRKVAAVACSSRYLADYFERWIGITANVVYPPNLSRGPFHKLGRIDNPFVTLVNPSDIKGISILLELARARPAVRFAGVPTWSTQKGDLAAMEAAGVTVLPPAEDFDDILRQTRVLLVPSLYHEVFGQVVVQALARGVPVIASDVGGIPEAKLGTRHLIPVAPIEELTWRAGYPAARRVPPQDIAPWLAALDELLGDPARYEAEAEASRAAAAELVRDVGGHHYERLMTDPSCHARPIDQPAS